MSMNNLDLLGHPIPDPKDLPRNKRLSSFDDLIGHTIMHIFEEDDCINEQMVIVTETRCHLEVNAVHGDCDEDDPRIQTTSVWGDDSSYTIEKYVNAETLRRHGLLGAEAAAAQKRADELKRIQYLKESAQESRSRAADNIRWAERDEAKAAELEAEINEAAAKRVSE